MSAPNKLQPAIMSAIMEASIVETDGIRVCRLDAAAIVDAFSIITAMLLATSAEARTTEGTKRLLRRQARQLEKRMAEFRRHTATHGSAFTVTQ